MADWQIQEAKARLSEVVERANSEGPQAITKHGKPMAVVVSFLDYSRLSPAKASASTTGNAVLEALLQFPFPGMDIEFDDLRSDAALREIDLGDDV